MPVEPYGLLTAFSALEIKLYVLRGTAEFFLSRYVRPRVAPLALGSRKIVHQASSVRRQRAVDAGAVDVVIGSLQAPGCCNGVVAAILQNLKGLSPQRSPVIPQRRR